MRREHESSGARLDRYPLRSSSPAPLPMLVKAATHQGPRLIQLGQHPARQYRQPDLRGLCVQPAVGTGLGIAWLPPLRHRPDAVLVSSDMLASIDDPLRPTCDRSEESLAQRPRRAALLQAAGRSRTRWSMSAERILGGPPTELAIEAVVHSSRPEVTLGWIAGEREMGTASPRTAQKGLMSIDLGLPTLPPPDPRTASQERARSRSARSPSAAMRRSACSP